MVEIGDSIYKESGELCNQENHYDQLIERENEALIICFNQKKKIIEDLVQ